jgi:hypothetical protein
MRINLRKASALVNEVRNAAKEINVEATHALNIYDDSYARVLVEARARLINDFNRRTRLDQAVATLRAEIGRANAQSGISDMLAEDAYLESLEGRLRAVAAATVRDDAPTVERQVQAKRASAEKSERSLYGFDGQLKLSVLAQGDIDDFNTKLKAIRKQRRELKDRTVELNVRTEFEVPSDVESVLREEGLI